MAVGLRVAVAFLAIASGPVVYVAARAHALDAGFDRVAIGDSVAAVTAAMGHAPGAPMVAAAGAPAEYRYRVWPLPTTWAITIADGKVVAKARLSSPQRP